MIEHWILAGKASVTGKSVTAFAVGSFLAFGAILADGNIGEGTGVAIGFVAGLICTVAAGSWYFRGMVDDQKQTKKEVESLREEIKRINHTIGCGKDLERY